MLAQATPISLVFSSVLSLVLPPSSVHRSTSVLLSSHHHILAHHSDTRGRGRPGCLPSCWKFEWLDLVQPSSATVGLMRQQPCHARKSTFHSSYSSYYLFILSMRGMTASHLFSIHYFSTDQILFFGIFFLFLERISLQVFLRVAERKIT